MMTPHVREPRITDIAWIARRLRDADVREMEAEGLPCEPFEALTSSVELSAEAYTAVDAKDPSIPVAMFGVGRDRIQGYGCFPVWFLGTDRLYEKHNVLVFLRWSKVWMDRFSRLYNPVGNFIHDKNRASLRWLAWCGFLPVLSQRNLFTNELFHLMVYDKNDNKRKE